MLKLILLTAGLAAVLVSMGKVVEVPSPKSAETGARVPPPPDYEEVLRNEFAEIERRGTVEAYELFIARHPDHPLAEKARARIMEIKKESQRQPDK